MICPVSSLQKGNMGSFFDTTSHEMTRNDHMHALRRAFQTSQLYFCIRCVVSNRYEARRRVSSTAVVAHYRGASHFLSQQITAVGHKQHQNILPFLWFLSLGEQSTLVTPT
jgi:alkylhydroperoxidase family enzyme